MMQAAELWIVAGPNGAGKTTLVNRGALANLLSNALMLNADDRTLDKLRKLGYRGFEDVPSSILEAAFISAATEVEAELPHQLQLGHKVCVETVLSTDKYKQVVEDVRIGCGFVGLIYVGIRSPEILYSRIASRVLRGGHDVPKDRVAIRWKRSIELIPWFVAHADSIWIYNNTDANEFVPPTLIAEGCRGKVKIYDRDAIPEITNALSHIQTEG